MHDFLPSRKVTAFVLVPIITVFSLWMVNRYYQTPNVAVIETKSSLEQTLEEGERLFQEQDTDGDGLKDWEEFLYQTDERNKDTDGDGLSDGLEVKKGQDPLIPGKGDSDEVTAEQSSGITFYKNDPTLTKTDLLARDIFVAYRELKEGKSLDLVEIRDKAIGQSLSESTEVVNTYVYTAEDVTNVSDTLSNTRAYKRAYDAAATELSTVQFTELELFERYVRDGDSSALVELLKDSERYESFAVRLAKAPVPEAVVQVHLELINNVMIFSETLKNMTTIEEDPVGAFVYAKKSIEDGELISQNVDALSLYFSRNNL